MPTELAPDLTFEEMKVLSHNESVCNDYHSKKSLLDNDVCQNGACNRGNDWVKDDSCCGVNNKFNRSNPDSTSKKYSNKLMQLRVLM